MPILRMPLVQGKLSNRMVIRKLYVPPTVVKTTNPLPPRVDPNFLPPATPYQPPASDDPVIVDVQLAAGAVPVNGGDLPVSADDVELVIKPGKIIGRRKVAEGGGLTYCSYQGIPYAQPPLGELRFKPPVPVESFAEQPLSCRDERGICTACMYLPEGGEKGTEDCLYLNVYTPDGASSGPLLPVMVWIHGGGFYTGSSSTNYYGPEYLVEQGVVLVTLNYRLGPLGFLALPSVGVHGNQGLKDQQLALRWVKENIAQFGGDPSNVTLFGESAGSASVNWHYLSPQSRQYFHKAICQSGSVLCPWGLQYQPEHKARKLAAVLGYTGDDDAGVLETLRNASADELVANAAKAFEETEKSIYFVSPFIPSIEDASSEDPIIPQRGEELLKQLNTTTIPLIHGVNSGEGLVMYGHLLTLMDELAGNLALALPLDLGVPRDFGPAVVEEIRQFYFQDQPVSQETFARVIEMVADVGFNFPIFAAAELHSRYQQEAPLYFYHFGFETELNQMRKYFFVPEGTPTAAHADELPYLFSGSEFTVRVDPDSSAGRARKLLLTLWTNFAKYTDPTPAEQVDSIGFRWEPVPPTAAGAPFEAKLLNLNEPVSVIENPFGERVQFWRALSERYNPNLLG